ncbi:MAG: arginine--tRNA ligase [Candidatus Eisenbacteria bacterium]|jgi:arginyl-tRNA synthetase|nr:arginine--tRNA ligase [Candidatus Eisenbacteria bacterium]
MMMPTIESIEQIVDFIKAALHAAAGEAAAGMPSAFERPKDTEHGDFASNLALLLAPVLHESPRAIAEGIVGRLRLPPEVVDGVEIAGPGFINVTLSPVVLRRGLMAALSQGEAFGRLSTGRGLRAQVEFVSANPTGPLTIGHGRQAVLGDAIARVLDNAGYQVDREYYFNDAGRQIRMLGESVRAQYLTLLGRPADVPEGGYHGEYVRGIAEAFRADRGDAEGETDVDVFSDFGKNAAFGGIQRTLERLRVRFDSYYSEASLYETGRIADTLRAMREVGVSYVKDGAEWLAGTSLGLDQDWVMVRGTGEPTYRLPDIAYHRHKLERGYDLVVDVFGADHQATYPVVLAAVQALGGDTSRFQVLIHQFVTVKRGGQDVRMSKRSGEFLTLDWLLDEVGVDAVRYFFLLRVRSSHLAFDIDLALRQSEENPVFYVQYAHARTAGILRFAAESGIGGEEPFDPTVLTQREELALIREILQFPVVLRQVTESLEPQKITVCLRTVATAFHQFYQHHRVIGDDRELSWARLGLVRATRLVLARGLSLLGVEAPERM